MTWTKVQKIQYGLWAVIILALWGLSAWKFRPREEPIFIHYNVYFGVDWVGPWYYGYIIPVSALAVLGLNFLFIRHIHEKNSSMSHIIVSWTTIALLFLSVSQGLMILLNGNA